MLLRQPKNRLTKRNLCRVGQLATDLTPEPESKQSKTMRDKRHEKQNIFIRKRDKYMYIEVEREREKEIKREKGREL